MLSKIAHKLLYRLTADLPYREIKDEGKDYLERYYLCTHKGKRYYLHCFLNSDPGRDLHSHKWHAWSFILCGWYWEQLSWGTRKVRWFNRITPDTFHRVVLPPVLDSVLVYMGQGRYRKVQAVPTGKTQPCWTLFCHNAANDVETWGFKRSLDEAEPGAWYMEPYKYEKEGNQKDWWLTAKTRREVKGA